MESSLLRAGVAAAQAALSTPVKREEVAEDTKEEKVDIKTSPES